MTISYFCCHNDLLFYRWRLTFFFSTPATLAMYWITFLVFSVFSAPDSPLHIENKQKVKLSYDYFLSVLTSACLI